MSRKKAQSEKTKSHPLRSFFRAEYPLFINAVSVIILLLVSRQLPEDLRHPVWLLAVFLWLFVSIFWSAMSVVKHADCLAVKFGEPYGTLILTIAVISIEVMMIATVMLHGANNPTMARDTMFSVIMIVLNGLVGLSLLLGGFRHREQHHNLQGTNSYLNAIIALSVLGMILPNFTTTTKGPSFSDPQELFLIFVSAGLYIIFLIIQTLRHSQYFIEPVDEEIDETKVHGHLQIKSTAYHVALLLGHLVLVVFLAEKFAIPLDIGIEKYHMPQAFGGMIVAVLVLSPEAMSAIRAARTNHLQRSINILLGSVLATIGLTIPAVLIIGLITKHNVDLGVQGGNLPLLILTLGVSIVTFTSGKTNILQGFIHLLLFGAFILLIFCP